MAHVSRRICPKTKLEQESGIPHACQRYDVWAQGVVRHASATTPLLFTESQIGKIPAPIKYNWPFHPLQKAQTHPPPLKGGILWAWGFCSRKNQKIPGAHEIGTAISGPRIAGGKIADLPVLPFLDFFSDLPRKNLKFTKDFLSLPNPQKPWKNQGKHQINQGNSKNEGKEGQG